MDSHCFDADPDPAQNLDADPDPDSDPGGWGVGQPKMCIPPGKILGTPLQHRYLFFGLHERLSEAEVSSPPKRTSSTLICKSTCRAGQKDDETGEMPGLANLEENIVK